METAHHFCVVKLCKMCYTDLLMFSLIPKTFVVVIESTYK